MCIRDSIYVDRFRGRLIFPIYSLSGKPIAVGGRIIEDNKKIAKYVNSPETNFFKKGDNLYNLNKARKVSNKYDEVYLVEGYMDVIDYTIIKYLIVLQILVLHLQINKSYC